MTRGDVEWICDDAGRERLLRVLAHPLTASQASRRTGFSRNRCSRILGGFTRRRLVRCLNPDASKSRVYGLTRRGNTVLRALGEKCRQPAGIDYDLYGWLLFRHRAPLLKALGEPMRASALRRKVTSRDPDIRISASNTREVLKLFHERGIVHKGPDPREGFPLYWPTDLGRDLQQLLLSVESANSPPKTPEAQE